MEDENTAVDEWLPESQDIGYSTPAKMDRKTAEALATRLVAAGMMAEAFSLPLAGKWGVRVR